MPLATEKLRHWDRHTKPQQPRKHKNKAFIDIRLRPGIRMPLVPYGLLRPNVVSSIKPEPHNISQRRQRSSDLRPQGICTTNFVTISTAVPEICLRTGRHPDGLMTNTTLLPGWSKNPILAPAAPSSPDKNCSCVHMTT